ncbi:extracellular solute-binding protein [Bosea sp. BK604]|uniref:ABC transporter substrate-binding protein n=1 Tax=Bosea sp. BK604 TaxID=2512180 RepID=UPI0010D84704|nr:extracellular solute-binding protein [Bosea sp. BK604]TCR67663.1 raffinose/stachyose/melibiose transport system substrate-binding protein [Bosea sp. BK604]
MAVELTRRAAAGALVGGLLSSRSFAQQVPKQEVLIDFFGLAAHNWQPVIDKFQQDYPTVKIKFTKFSTDELKQALRVGASSGKMPDLWWNWGGSLASPYNQAGLSVEITPAMISSLKLDEFLIPAGIELHKDQGKLYGIPHRIGPFSFFYKKELFEKFGLKPPQSLAELETIADTFKKNNIVPFSNGGKFSWMTMRYFDFFLESFAGPAGHDALLDGKASWKSEPVTKAFQKLKDWADKGYFNAGFLNVDPSVSVTMLYNNSAAMVFESITTETNRMAREGQDPSNFGTFPLPTGQTPRRVPGSPSQIQISAKTSKDKQDAGLLFAVYVAKPEIAPFTNANVGFPSATKNVFPTGNAPSSRQWAEWIQADIGLYRLTDQGLPQNVVAAFFEAQDSMLLDMISPAEAGADVQKAIEKNARR